MKKILSILAALLCSASALAGERVFLSLDRGIYVAGDELSFSAFCLDTDGKPSGLSAVAYVEVHNSSRMVATAKVALSEGRGAGSLLLPKDLPTSNYAIYAYTAYACGEEGFNPTEGERIFSVFNTFSTARVDGGVVISEVPQMVQEEVTSPVSIDFVVGEEGILTVRGPKGSYCVSVCRSDLIPAPTDDGFLPYASGRHFSSKRIPEYEGEIISGHVVCTSESDREALNGKCAFISAPGGSGDIYSAPIAPDGSVRFFTGNIFGRKDLVCEIEGMPSGCRAHLELDSPFVDFGPGEIPVLTMDPIWKKDLLERGNRSMVRSHFSPSGADEIIPVRHNPLFLEEGTVYRLEDYTRFPTMQEVFTEFIPEIRWSRDEGKYQIRVRVNEAYGLIHYARGSSLFMIDGIPVFDHDKIMAYDPLLVEYIRIYPDTYFLGERSFEGIVDIVTYKHNAPTLSFDEGVRVVDFAGVSLPFSSDGLYSDEALPESRETLLWQPLAELSPDGSSFKFHVPEDVEGLVVSVEGLGEDGKTYSLRKILEKTK